MFSAKVEGIWPCFVHLQPSKASSDIIFRWVNEKIPLILSKSNLPHNFVDFIEKDDYHISITPGLMLQKHEFQMMKSLTGKLIEILSEYPRSGVNKLTYSRETHLSFCDLNSTLSRSTIPPIYLRVQSVSVLGEHLVLEFCSVHNEPTVSVLNEYYNKTCEFFHQETYEEKLQACNAQRIFHCSVGKVTKEAENSDQLKQALRSIDVDFSEEVEITDLHITKK